MNHSGAFQAHSVEADGPITGKRISVGCRIIRPKKKPIRVAASAKRGMCADLSIKICQQGFIAQADHINLGLFHSDGNPVAAYTDIALVGGDRIPCGSRCKIVCGEGFSQAGQIDWSRTGGLDEVRRKGSCGRKPLHGRGWG